MMGMVLGHIFNHVTKKVPPGKRGSAFPTRLVVYVQFCSLHSKNFYSFSFQVFLLLEKMYKKIVESKVIKSNPKPINNFPKIIKALHILLFH